jgi:hypothetical protein
MALQVIALAVVPKAMMTVAVPSAMQVSMVVPTAESRHEPHDQSNDQQRF